MPPCPLQTLTASESERNESKQTNKQTHKERQWQRPNSSKGNGKQLQQNCSKGDQMTPFPAHLTSQPPSLSHTTSAFRARPHLERSVPIAACRGEEGGGEERDASEPSPEVAYNFEACFKCNTTLQQLGAAHWCTSNLPHGCMLHVAGCIQKLRTATKQNISALCLSPPTTKYKKTSFQILLI